MLAERAVLEVKVFLPQRRRLDDVAIGIEYRKVLLRHLLLHTMFRDHWPAAKLSTVPDHRVPSPGHSSTGPSAADRRTARQQSSGAPTDSVPAVFAQYEKLAHRMVERPVERRPAVYQGETRQAAVGVDCERGAPVLLPIRIQPLIIKETVGRNLTIAAANRGKLGEVVFIELYKIGDDRLTGGRHCLQANTCDPIG